MAEWVMRVPLISAAQVRILSEGLVEPAGEVQSLPADLRPAAPFSAEMIQAGLPEPGPFTCRDLRWAC